jgi:hypothetical protein
LLPCRYSIAKDNIKKKSDPYWQYRQIRVRLFCFFMKGIS